MSRDPSAELIAERLRRASELSDLRPDHRFDGKVDLSRDAITARLHSVAELNALCAALRNRR